MILSVVNRKGGTGKTTTAVALAAGFARRGRKTLLVDLDAQGSATTSLGFNLDDGEPSIADLLFNQQSNYKNALRPSGVKKLDLIAGSEALAGFDAELAGERQDLHLQRVLQPARKEYAYIVVDCPPSLSLVTVNALIASDRYLVPVTPEHLSLEGLVKLENTVIKLKTGGDVAKLLGIALVMVDNRARVTGEIIRMIREHYGAQVFKTEIPRNIRISEAPSFGKSIYEYDNKSKGALAYEQLTGEVLHRLR